MTSTDATSRPKARPRRVARRPQAPVNQTVRESGDIESPTQAGEVVKTSKSKRTPAKVPNKRRGAQPKYDWELVSQVYIEGLKSADGDITWLNLREISDRYAIPYARVRDTSAKDRWGEQRAAYQIQAAQERKKARIAKLADNSTDFDEKSYNAAKIGVGLITTRLAEILKESQVRKVIRDEALQRLAMGEAVDKQDLWSAINYREMDGLSRAARTFQEMGQRALGTDVQKVDITQQVEAEVHHVHSVREEMLRDDDERLSAVIEALASSNPQIQDVLGVIMDAEIVEDEDNEQPRELGPGVQAQDEGTTQG